MNIFTSYTCPVKSARLLDNRRANKMIVESFQLMSNAMWIHGSQGYYKKTHLNHPCSIWIATSRANYHWVLEHTCELLDLYNKRYKRIHKCNDYLETAKNYLVSKSFPSLDLTPFVNCTDFKELTNVQLAYRLHLFRKWYKEGRVFVDELWDDYEKEFFEK